MSMPEKSRTVAALGKVINEMQFLVDHPRMQQRNWVASGKQWLPVLHDAVEDLQGSLHQQDYAADAYVALMVALERAGLRIEKQDETHWGYHWRGDVLKGSYVSRAAAVEAALRERLP